MKETELAEPVAQLLKQYGYTVYSEAPLGFGSNRVIDIIGLSANKVIAVELKLSLTKQVIRQAYHCGLIANKVYVAVATNPRKLSFAKCKRRGIGIISVKNSKAEIVLAAPNSTVSSPVKTVFRQRLEPIEPGVYAGKPNQKGVGPAHDCFARIKDYLSAYPKATWKEIYNNVESQYSSVGSMQLVMNNRFNFRKKQYLQKVNK